MFQTLMRCFLCKSAVKLCTTESPREETSLVAHITSLLIIPLKRAKLNQLLYQHLCTEATVVHELVDLMHMCYMVHENIYDQTYGCSSKFLNFQIKTG